MNEAGVNMKDDEMYRKGKMRALAIVGKARLTREFAPFETPPPTPLHRYSDGEGRVERGEFPSGEGRKAKEGWEVWTFNEYAFANGLRPTGMLEMHADALTADRYAPGYRTWLMKPHPFPIWMQARDERIPASAALPWREISDRYMKGIWHWHTHVDDFYSCTTAYALGLAIHLGYDNIYLFGLEMRDKPEYVAERDCVYFWLGMANALGVEIHTHKLSDLFREVAYGTVR